MSKRDHKMAHQMAFEEEEGSEESDDFVPTRPKEKNKHDKSSKSSKSSKKSSKRKRHSSSSSNEDAKKKRKPKPQKQQHKISKTTTTTTTTEKESLVITIDDDLPLLVMPTEAEHFVSKSKFYKLANANITGLTDALSEILQQEEAKEQVIFKIYSRALTPLRSKKTSERICSIHLTAGSGVGKSRTAELLAEYFHAGPGTTHPAQYVIEDLSKYVDQSHATSITGSAKGLVGYNDKTLVDRLIEAAKPIPGIDNGEIPFIILHLEEACKGHVSFMNALNPLLSGGIITDTKNNRFTIPDTTLLIIIWTTNFAEGIKQPNQNPDQSIRIVHQRMREKGFDNCDIARMGGDPILYNPLSADDMYTIIEKKGAARIPLHLFSSKYGVPVYRDENENAEPGCNILIKNILKTYNPDLGVRSPLERYMTELDTLLTNSDIVAYKSNTVATGFAAPRQPSYWNRQIEMTPEDRASTEAIFLEKHQEINIAVGQTFKNRAHFSLIFKNPTIPLVEYIVLKFYKNNTPIYAYRVLCPVVEAPVNDNNNNNNIDTRMNDQDDENEIYIDNPRQLIQYDEMSLKYNHLQLEMNQAKSSILDLQRQIDEMKHTQPQKRAVSLLNAIPRMSNTLYTFSSSSTSSSSRM